MTCMDRPWPAVRKTKARDILTAIRTLTRIEHEQRPATLDEQQALARFPGFGPVALSLFPDPVTGRSKRLLAAARRRASRAALAGNYDSAKRTTFNASTPPLSSSGPCMTPSPASACPEEATVLEPGCGSGISPPGLPQACALSASSSTASPGASPAPSPTP